MFLLCNTSNFILILNFSLVALHSDPPIRRCSPGRLPHPLAPERAQGFDSTKKPGEGLGLGGSGSSSSGGGSGTELAQGSSSSSSSSDNDNDNDNDRFAKRARYESAEAKEAESDAEGAPMVADAAAPAAATSTISPAPQPEEKADGTKRKKNMLMQLFSQSGVEKLQVVLQHLAKFLNNKMAGKILVFGHHQSVLDKLSAFLK